MKEHKKSSSEQNQKNTEVLSAANIVRRPPNDGRYWECQCARCGSSMDFQDCDYCGGEGYSDHECGEDTCCCLYPEDNVTCDICHGDGGWWMCLSSQEWCEANPLPGRENIKQNTQDWYLAA